MATESPMTSRDVLRVKPKGAEIVLFCDYSRDHPVTEKKPAEPAEVIILPVITIDRHR